MAPSMTMLSKPYSGPLGICPTVRDDEEGADGMDAGTTVGAGAGAGAGAGGSTAGVRVAVVDLDDVALVLAVVRPPVTVLNADAPDAAVEAVVAGSVVVAAVAVVAAVVVVVWAAAAVVIILSMSAPSLLIFGLVPFVADSGL